MFCTVHEPLLGVLEDPTAFENHPAHRVQLPTSLYARRNAGQRIQARGRCAPIHDTNDLQCGTINKNVVLRKIVVAEDVLLNDTASFSSPSLLSGGT